MRKFLIKVNGNQYEVEVDEVRADGSVVESAPVAAQISGVSQVAATSSPAPVAAPAPAPKAETKSAAPAGSIKITAPMPGTILKVNVAAGESVKKGQILCILEAMKMENEIVASADGKVASVNVTKGASVNAGDVLVSLA